MVHLWTIRGHFASHPAVWLGQGCSRKSVHLCTTNAGPVPGTLNGSATSAHHSSATGWAPGRCATPRDPGTPKEGPAKLAAGGQSTPQGSYGAIGAYQLPLSVSPLGHYGANRGRGRLGSGTEASPKLIYHAFKVLELREFSALTPVSFCTQSGQRPPGRASQLRADGKWSRWWNNLEKSSAIPIQWCIRAKKIFSSQKWLCRGRKL